MTKADIVNDISKQTGVEKAEVQQIVEAFMDSIKNALIANKDKSGKESGVFLRGFGSFIIKERAPKTARLIKAEKTIHIENHKIPAFKPSKSFVNSVRGELKYKERK